jgi:hypothetical protein
MISSWINPSMGLASPEAIIAFRCCSSSGSECPNLDASALRDRLAHEFVVSGDYGSLASPRLPFGEPQSNELESVSQSAPTDSASWPPLPDARWSTGFEIDRGRTATIGPYKQGSLF